MSNSIAPTTGNRIESLYCPQAIQRTRSSSSSVAWVLTSSGATGKESTCALSAAFVLTHCRQ